jgi:toxin HigB-1
MIVRFKNTATRSFAETGRTKLGWQTAAAVAMRKIDALRAATKLEDLRVPPGNKLEALVRDRAGQHSIRINDQWRICFRWSANGAEDVEITDYH